MASRKTLTVISFAAISLLVLLVTSKRLGNCSDFEAAYYHQNDGHKSSHHAPQGTLGEETLEVDIPPPHHHSKHPHAHHDSSATVDDHNADFPPRPMKDPICDNFPHTSKILLVMKTGASESFNRVPTQLMTVLRCLPEFFIFGDMDQHIAGYHIHDSLEAVLPEVKDGNPDFDLYRRQQWCLVDQDNCNKLGDPAREGWDLDKYKFVHIAEKVYAWRPNYDWYVFMEADTYVLWPNMVEWLGQLDPKKKHYLGSLTLINNFGFGHGGSGYILSQAAMEPFVGQNPGIANRYDARMRNECCGDFVFALALKDATGLVVQQMWPTINGEKPSTFPFGPSHWCHPIVTMHHMNSEEISSFWQFERTWYDGQQNISEASPLLLRDIYDVYLAPNLQEAREDWDNLSDNKLYLDTEDENREWEDRQLDQMKNTKEYNEFEKKAHLSFEDCGKACKSLSDKECFQWKYRDGICSISDSFRLGKPVKKADREKDRMTSGWDIEKINKWIAKQGDCNEVLWPKVRS